MYKKIIIIFFAFVFFLQLYFVSSWVFIEDKRQIWSIEIYDRNNKKFVDKRFKDGYYKKLSKEKLLNSKFVKSLILIEDKRFYSHFWVDILSKLRAFNQNFNSKKILSWWSTITEQYLKNKYFLWEKRNYFQKFKEANLAFYFSIFNSKEDTLYKYLDNQWKNIFEKQKFQIYQKMK